MAATTKRKRTKGVGQGVGGGRPPKSGETMGPGIYLRVPETLLAKLDALVDAFAAEHGITPSRADVIRKLLEDGTRDVRPKG